MKNKKILIISMTGGFGHIRAGQALLDYANEYLPDMQAEHVNLFEVNPLFKNVFPKFYTIISQKVPFVWGAMYNFSDHQFISFVIRKLSMFDRYSIHRIKNYIEEKKPDAIIFTSPFLLSVFAPVCRTLFSHIKMGVVVTDYYGHPFYNIPFLDYYFVPDVQVGQELQSIGVKKEKIVVTGIPINPKFYVQENIAALKLRHGIKNDTSVVLFITSFKITKKELLEAIEKLVNFTPKINVIVLANGNEEFYHLVKESFSNKVILVRWTDVIEEYMKISDVIISKAGGLTVSECLAVRKPLIMVNPIPGQEEHNAEFMQRNNFGVKVDDVSQVTDVLPTFLSSSHVSQMPLIVQESPAKKIFQYILP